MRKSIMHGDAAMAAYAAVAAANGNTFAGRKMDAAGDLLGFARSFEYIEAEFYRYKYGLIQWRSIFGAPETGPSYIENTTYRELEDVGDADWVDEKANDYPKQEVIGRENTQPVRAIGASFAYTWDEVARASVLGLNIDAEKARIARRAIEQKLDVAMAVGNSPRNIPSFVTNSNLTAVTATTKTGGGTVWTTYGTGAKVIEIVTDVVNMAKAVDVNSKYAYGPAAGKVLVVGTGGWSFLNNTIMIDTGYLGETFGAYLLRTIPSLQRIEYWPQLDTVGTGGKERIMMWVDNQEVAKATLYVDMQMTPPQPQGFSWEVKVRSKTAGVKVKNWTAIVYMDSTQP